MDFPLKLKTYERLRAFFRVCFCCCLQCRVETLTEAPWTLADIHPAAFMYVAQTNNEERAASSLAYITITCLFCR